MNEKFFLARFTSCSQILWIERAQLLHDKNWVKNKYWAKHDFWKCRPLVLFTKCNLFKSLTFSLKKILFTYYPSTNSCVILLSFYVHTSECHCFSLFLSQRFNLFEASWQLITEGGRLLRHSHLLAGVIK